MTSSQTNYRSLYEPESNISTLDGNLSVELPFQRKQDYVLYNTGNADLANISVPEGKRMTSVHNGEVNHDEPVNPSIYSQNCRSMHQATDDTDSFDHTSSLHSYEEQLRLQSIQRQGTMESYRRGIVLPGSELLLRQPHDSLPNLSLTNEPQGSLPNLSLENHNSLASQYPSHIHQSTSQYQSHKVVLPNHSGMSGEVSHNAYQHQAGRPNIHIGVSQCTSQGQAAKVVFPNRSAMLGEANHNAYQNQASSSNIGVNQYFSQDQYSKVVLPNRSAVLGEINQNLPLDIQHQSNIALTGREPTSVDQTTPLGYNNSFKSNRTGMKEPQPASLISQRNQKLDKQHPYNNTIPPVFQHMPSSNISLFMDKGGTEEFQGNQGQYGSSNQTSSLNQSGVPPNQSVAQSNHHGLPNFVANQQPSAPIGYQVPPSQNHPRIEKSNYMQHSDSGYTGKKVFILHFAQAVDDNPVLKLGVTLRRMKVDVTLDFFEYDNPPDSWPLWYERKIKDSDVVLCIITENFYHQLTSGNHVLGYSVYNLMNSSQNIAFRAVFIDARKEMEYVPPAMRGATCYSISSDRLTPNDDEFANLYAFLTGQNRVKKPELGNMVILAPKRSRFGQFSGGPAPTYSNSRNMHQQQQQQRTVYQPMAPPAPPPAAVSPAGEMPNVEQANFIFTLLGGDATPIKSIHSHNKMFMQLASKMMAEWEALGRMLNVNEPDIYAIKVDNAHSVTEQAVQMFQQWVRRNGSRATLGALTTAVYDSGPQYWNLLDTINKFAPQQ